MEFEWDEAKNWSNQQKHGVGFEIAYSFDWVGAGVFVDDRQDYGEDRLVAYGDMHSGGSYVIVFTLRAGRYRIISARHFGRKDQFIYDELKKR